MILKNIYFISKGHLKKSAGATKEHRQYNYFHKYSERFCLLFSYTVCTFLQCLILFPEVDFFQHSAATTHQREKNSALEKWTPPCNINLY